MKKTARPKFLDLADPAARRKAIEEAVRALNEKAVAQGEPEPTFTEVKSRFAMSCGIVMWCSVIGSVLLALASVYFITLPRPYSYSSTQDGKLYEIKPYQIEK